MTDTEKREPIAITGIGLRYPGGAEDVDSYWNLMTGKVDAITEIPEDRWSISSFYNPARGAKGKTYSKWGGFISKPDYFDAQLFGITAGEAECMDPQQRLLLEAAWHALEDGGRTADCSEEKDVGVFIGVSTTDYATQGYAPHEVTSASPFTATGSAKSIVANRISHTLNFTGPSVAFDTACSSSLVALHYACASLYAGECSEALVGGVNFIMNPTTWVSFCGMTALSKDGRCKAFDSSADGFVRGEGVGVVLLKPLSRAIADGDNIYATILATGCNQDGKTPSISMPDREAQENLIRRTLRIAGLEPSDISYIEAHGTGTAVGDPIEATAIGNVLGRGSARQTPLLMGSVKSNIGHLESGAGIAGLIKASLVLQNRHIPPNLHFNQPNPEIAFEDLQLRVPIEGTDLPDRNEAEELFAAVNSFGFGGTNAHAVIGSAPLPSTETNVAKVQIERSLLSISAQTEGALASQVTNFRELLSKSGTDFHAICAQSLTGRTLHRHRIIAAANSPEEMIATLCDWESDTPNPLLVSEQCLSPKTKEVVFVYSGQGSQWFRMGRGLYGSNDTFRAKIDLCRDLILALDGFDLVEELMREENESRVQKTEIAQPAIFAVQVALTDVWREMGIVPAAVCGHSVGEVAAAHVAGALTLEQAVRVIFHRGDTMGMARGGKMIAVAIDPEKALESIRDYGDRLSLAAINGPVSVSISGESGALEEVFQKFEPTGVFCRYVPVDYAFHSSQMDPVEKELLARLRGLAPEAPSLPIYSSVTGKKVTGVTFDASYWWSNVRQTVRFGDCVKSILDDGFRAFLEVSSHPVLKPSLQQCLSANEVDGAIVAYSQHRKEEAEDSIFLGLAQMIAKGCVFNCGKLSGRTSRKIDLPLYPFERERFWKESRQWTELRKTPLNHPFLANRKAGPEFCWQFDPDLKTFIHFRDHVVDGNVLMPGAAYLEMGLALGHQVLTPGYLVLEDVSFVRPLPLTGDESSRVVRISLEDGGSGFKIHSGEETGSGDWQLHAEGALRATKKAIPVPASSLDELRDRCADEVAIEAFYQIFTNAGLDYGPAFQGLRRIHAGEGEVLAEVETGCPDEINSELYHIFPALLDSAFQTILLTLPREALGSGGELFLPIGVNRLRFQAKPNGRVMVHSRLVSFDGKQLEVNILIMDGQGVPLVSVEGFICQRVKSANGGKKGEPALKYISQRWDHEALENVRSRTKPAEFLPPLVELGEVLRQRVADMEDWKQSGLAEGYTIPSALCLALIEAALLEAGFNPEVGEEFSLTGAMEATGIIERHHALSSRFIDYLTGEAVFEKIGNRSWRTLRKLSADRVASATRRMIEYNPYSTADLFLFTLVGSHLADMLQGKEDIVPILFNPANAAMLERLYSGSRSSDVTNDIITETVAALAAKLPKGRKLRILEIGAGTGATARQYIRALDPGEYELVFTDVSEAFFVKSEEAFSEFPGVVFRGLDISRPPAEAGFGRDYDIVIAADVMHATPDIAASLANARSLLREGGCFILMDLFFKNHVMFDLIVGLTAGAGIGAADPAREGGIGFEKDGWLEALRTAGFETPVVVPDTSERFESIHAVFLARNGEPETEATPSGEQTGKCWLIIEDEKKSGSSIYKFLEDSGHRVESIPASEWRADIDTVSSRAAEIEGLTGVIFLGALDTTVSSMEMDIAALEASQETVVHQPVEVIRTLVSKENLKLPGGLWVVTRGACRVLDSDITDVVQSPLTGIGRVVYMEVRDLGLRLVDLSAEPCEDEWCSLATEISRIGDELPRDEDQIAFRGEGRYLPRCHPDVLAEQTSSQLRGVHEQCLKIGSDRYGSLASLRLEPSERRQPTGDEVEIRIHAVGMNFRDVMKALGIYPTTIGDAEMLGDEFSGEVVSTGESVTRFKPGDRVTGIAMGSFRSYWTGSEDHLCALPDRMSFLEGATVLTAYSTAHHALHDIGRIREGERILIHSAAGGVGIATVRLALLAGAEIFATAGTETKRTLLKRMGAKHVFDSRTLEFADEIMTVTDGEGIDLVLNSLAGEAIPKSLGCLRQGGRFMEIGKRDIYENTRLGLRPFRNGLTFSSIDLAASMDGKSIAGRSLKFEKMMEDELFRSLPFFVFPFGDPSEAFRFMSQGKHIGKIVMSLTGRKARPVGTINPVRTEYETATTALITGGTIGLGLKLAREYMERGVGSLVLLSRSGRGTGNEELEEFIAYAEKRDVQVIVYAVDVANESAMRDVFCEIREDLPPLQIIVHCAAVLADELFLKMTREQFETGFRAKVSGGWNLHRLSQQDPVSEFIVISSLATVIGSPGQTNYVAANLFIEQLVNHRRAVGMPGLAVNLDVIVGTGIVSRNEELSAYMKKVGWTGISGADAVEGIFALQSVGAAVKGIHRTVFGHSKGLGLALSENKRCLELFQGGSVSEENSPDALRSKVIAATPEERLEIIGEILREQIGKLLRLPLKAGTQTIPLNEQGVDSLMAVEFVTLLERKFAITIPTSNMMNAPTVGSLSATISELITGEKATPYIPAPAEVGLYPAFSQEDTVIQDSKKLRDHIDAQSLLFSRSAESASVFLTGANGLLGVHLALDLLNNSDVFLNLLVRGKDQEDSLSRLESACHKYELDWEVFSKNTDRWKIITGDLTKSRFGLSAESYADLAEAVDTIVHGGAIVNHVSGYQDLRAVNVLGTMEIIALASTGKPKGVHFTSSVAVYSNTGISKSEGDPPDELESLLEGYGQSKAVCELLLRHAEEKGMALSVSRIGPVVGDDKSGISAEHDAIWLLLKTCVIIGAAPQNNRSLYLSPVDFVSRVLSKRILAADYGQTMNLVNTSETSLGDLIEAARRNGYEIEMLPNLDFAAKVHDAGNPKELGPYFMLRKELVDELLCNEATSGLQTTGIGRFMEDHGISPIQMDEKRLDSLINRLVQIGFLPLPAKSMKIVP